MTQYNDTAATTVEAFYEAKGFGCCNLGAGATAMLKEFTSHDYIIVTGEYPFVPDELTDKVSVSIYEGTDDSESRFTLLFKSSFDLEDMPDFSTMADAKKWFTDHMDRALAVEGA